MFSFQGQVYLFYTQTCLLLTAPQVFVIFLHGMLPVYFITLPFFT